MTWVPFESFEDAFAIMAKAEEEANDRITDEQRLIQPGDYVYRVYTFGPGNPPILVLGQLFTEEEFLEREKAAGPAMDEEEIANARDQWQGRWSRGFIFGEWFSLTEPRGELGDAHVSTLVGTIPKETFETLLALIQHGEDPLDLLR